jgi:uncharacterized protein
MSGLFNFDLFNSSKAKAIAFVLGFFILFEHVMLEGISEEGVINLNGLKFKAFETAPDESSERLNAYGLIVSGLLVGLGTYIGSGCTSGHGLCGLPWFSLRSLCAVLTFMATGILVATLHLDQYFMTTQNLETTFTAQISEWILYKNQEIQLALLCGMIAIHLCIDTFLKYKRGTFSLNKFIEPFLYILFGILAALGLLISGMCWTSKVIGFLRLNESWDMSLMFVMGSGVLINLVFF